MSPRLRRERIEQRILRMQTPETRYAISPDGVYLAYQTLGEGPRDIVWQPDWPGNIEFEWDAPTTGPFLRELASFSRVIAHDQRGIGLSSRNAALPDPCGVWRWDVKTLSDPHNHDVNFTPQATTVPHLRTLHVPASLGTSRPRIWPIEKRTYTVHATS
jgi:pimeloyl-ACP methyl ester carboxylesterase